MNNIRRNNAIDVLKGVSIIAVFFYHLGLLPNGYLGVDVFFVISGYFVIKGFVANEFIFSYKNYVEKKVLRFFPLIICLSIASLFVGIFVMLPDDLENLAETIVASNLFSNNILQLITTKDYWNVANEFKPLMHTWYISVLFQIEIIFPLFVIIIGLINKKITKFSKTSVFIVFLFFFTFLSLIGYLYRGYNSAKFYLPQYRFFEFGFGGLVFFIKNKNKFLPIISLILILLLFSLPFTNNLLFPLLVLIFTCLFLCSNCNINYLNNEKCLSFLGKYSFSIYIWHQFFIAFYRYIIGYELRLYPIIIFIILGLLFFYFSIFFFEKKNENIFKRKLFKFIFCGLYFIVLICSLIIYMKGGIVRDFPELNIYKSNPERNLNVKYCDRIYDYDKPFEKNEKINVLVLGDSYARDVANILLESSLKDFINISYSFGFSEEGINRIKDCDYCFISSKGCITKDSLPEKLNNLIADCYEKFYIVGTKSFGYNNGNVYSKRYRKDYFESKVVPDKKILADLFIEKKEWGGKLIDIMEPLMDDFGNIRVFTDTNRYISQDTLHLTKDGAEYLARIIDFSNYIKIK